MLVIRLITRNLLFTQVLLALPLISNDQQISDLYCTRTYKVPPYFDLKNAADNDF